MEPVTAGLTTPFQVLAHERALVMEAELAAVAAATADEPGKFVGRVEDAVAAQVRELGRVAVEEALARAACAPSKKSARAAAPPCRGADGG